MKLRFSLLTLLMIPVAFGLGWWLGMNTQNERLDQLEKNFATRTAEVEQIAHALNGAIFINQAYRTLDTTEPEEQERKRINLLIPEIYFLAQAEPYKKENQKDVFLNRCWDALDLLGVSKFDDFTSVVKKSDLTKRFKAPFLDPKHPEYKQAMSLVRRTLDWSREQPNFPGIIWLEAIQEVDAELLKSAYSQRIQSQEIDWPAKLAEYREQLVHDLGEANSRGFSFSASTSLDQDGQIEVYWMTKPYRTFNIVHETTGWKLDEFGKKRKKGVRNL